MTYFVPVLFTCLLNGQCDFVYTDPVKTQEQCQGEIKAKSEYFEALPSVKAYRPACLEITIKLTETKIRM